MPYGPRFGRMEDPDSIITQAKDAAVGRAITNKNLSYIIHTTYDRSDFDAWNCETYGIDEQENGNLRIVDKSVDVCVRIYVKDQWFGMVLMYQPHAAPGISARWEEFTPAKALHNDQLRGEV